MPNDASWYEVVEGDFLQQGDILKACPVPLVQGLEDWPVPEGRDLDITVELTDVVVLSQSCDLVNDKIHNVVLGQVIAWHQACELLVNSGQAQARSSKFRKVLVAGNVPNLSLLNKHTEEPSFPWSVVDFHKLVVLPKSLLTSFAAKTGPRLRLKPPYREHLAQAFARYFMRVGLPHDAKAFIIEGGA